MIEHWIEGLYQSWGIKAELSALDGEFDLNIKAEGVDGTRYLVKIMRPACDIGLVEMQCEALKHIHASATSANVPLVVQSMVGRDVETLMDEEGNERLVWVLSFLEGVTYASFMPKSHHLVSHLGSSIAHLHSALDGFEHASLQRDFKWNLLQASWINDQLSVISDSHRRDLLSSIMLDYAEHLESVQALPSFAIHNDINDFNLLANAELIAEPIISGIVDFGDMCAAPRVCELAIAGAYIMLDHPQPEAALSALVAAYHAVLPLSANEIALIYPLLRCRLAVSVVNSTIEALTNPDDPYVTISQGPAWRLIESSVVAHSLVTARLRVACGLAVSESATRVGDYLAQLSSGACAAIIGVEVDGAPCRSLSVEGCSMPQNPFNLLSSEARSLGHDATDTTEVWLGYYNEPRLVYTDSAFRQGPWKASNRRTVHLGVDVFAPAATQIHAPLDGVVCVIENRQTSLDYGGMVVLEHMTPSGDSFYSLYGHLNPEVCKKLQQGQKLKAGDVFAELGTQEHNGGWTPHLHLQLAMGIGGLGTDWPGVANPDDLKFWNAMCPNPAVLLNLPNEKVGFTSVDETVVLQQRREDFGSNLKLSYSKPVMLLRGWKHYLFDQWGRPYLDAYNNVPHVGHAHPRLQALVSEQLKRLNSNTRYLHPAQSALARKITSKTPEHLCVCYFVNSGSEANELALRLSRAHSGGKDMVTPDHGYHGNTTGAIDISAYKFNAPGGVGKPDWVQLVDIPDVYGGKFRQPEADCSQVYADQVDDAIEKINEAGGILAGFIAETFPSVGGQIVPPDGYLERVYRKIRAAGGVCIADEVQTGLGRLGEYYFAFEQQKVLPDIVVLGKPIGNGHPIGVVVTTQEIADSFAQGPEFFSTFGGSTLSCMVAKEVLDIVDDEALQLNALQVGKQALEGLALLKKKHSVIGDVRGIGLFIGVAFVTDQEQRTPATEIAAYVVNRLREHRILAGLEGPDNNVLKVRPPLSIGEDDVEMLLGTLDLILSETVISQKSV
ncbi:MAG: 4-aminobutyrate aminotransferase-like enzyme/Ser/Thr protein kinase RdoA (MazF antagonist) [Granulosicoccus sp.]|jgi:4-aminobutyrate aminotransferase-like enzyme/Ser/Thr protein kinase RdoA (MazF antagonist)